MDIRKFVGLLQNAALILFLAVPIYLLLSFIAHLAGLL